MKFFLLFATLSAIFAKPTALAKSELETLRARCAEQERQIRHLEGELSKLRDQGPEEKIAPSPPETAQTPNPPATPITESIYIVKAGDHIEKIATEVKMSVSDLAKINGLKPNSIIRPGQKLKILSSPTSASTPAAPKENSSPSTPKASGKTHIIQQGDTFFSISRKYQVSTASLIAANPNIKPSALRPGLEIKISETEPNEKTSSPQATSKPAAEKEVSNLSSNRKFKAITVESEITYGDFAAKHGTNTERLNALNGLDLTTATLLAKGSELYVPVQP